MENLFLSNSASFRVAFRVVDCCSNSHLNMYTNYDDLNNDFIHVHCRGHRYQLVFIDALTISAVHSVHVDHYHCLHSVIVVKSLLGTSVRNDPLSMRDHLLIIKPISLTGIC